MMWRKTMDGLAYSEKQVDILMSAVSLLLPLSTGFVVLVGAGLARLAAAGALRTQRQRATVAGSFLLVMLSIGLWSGCLAFIVDCARPFDLPGDPVPALHVGRLNAEWSAAIACAQLGLLSFFFALLCYAAAAYPALGVVIRDKVR
jgi:hypothetical protein